MPTNKNNKKNTKKTTTKKTGTKKVVTYTDAAGNKYTEDEYKNLIETMEQEAASSSQYKSEYTTATQNSKNNSIELASIGSTNYEENNSAINSRVNQISSSKNIDYNVSNPYSDNSYFKSAMHYNKLFSKSETDLMNKTYRFGIMNQSSELTETREYLFFTKPDLNIFKRDDVTGVVDTSSLNDYLATVPYWQSMFKYHKHILYALQSSAENGRNSSIDPFNHLLQNMANSNLEIPALSGTSVDTATNIYGVNYTYKGSSEASDDSLDTSIEFRDNKDLDVYWFFRSYEEYENLKYRGVIRPYKKYIEKKILHDQFAIYKFLVDMDMETIIYYGKYYGVYPNNLPRDVFSTASFDNGISYTIDFKTAFYEDMKPEILYDFDYISKDIYKKCKYQVPVYNNHIGRVDGRAVRAAYINSVTNEAGNKIKYKLKWRGDDTI